MISMKSPFPLPSLCVAIAGFCVTLTVPRLSAEPIWAQTPAVTDPTCAPVSRFSMVLAGRFEAAKLARYAPKHAELSALATGKPELSVAWDQPGHAPRLKLKSQLGAMLQLESAASLGAGSWTPLIGLELGGAEYDWTDSTTGSSGTRFYRLAQITDPLESDPLEDFKLLDQAGKAHELFYHTELAAIVVASAGDAIANLATTLQSLKPLVQTYPTNRVQFWILLGDPTATRATVDAQVKAAGMNIPVLLDPQNLGAVALRLQHSGDVVVVEPTRAGLPVFTAAFRGQLQTGATDETAYLQAAIAHLTQQTPRTFFRRPSDGTALSHLDAPVPSYTRDIAPLLHQHCVKCHRPNDVAPFALTNYDTALGWAPVIKHALLAREMPPWHIDPQQGTWANSLALPEEDRATLVRWLDAGAPRGDGPDPLAQLPLPESYRVWPSELGPPDAIVTPPLQAVKAVGIEQYRYIFVQTPNPTNVWLRAAIILPSVPAVVHHYLVWNGKVGNKSPLPGFSTYETSLAGYAPGMAPYIYPSDTGFFLTASNWVTFNLHYTPNGTATNDLPQLALWYHKTPPAKAYQQFSVNNIGFSIPPGNPEFPVEATWTFPSSVRLHRLNPHMHLRGKYASFEALYPDGKTEMLLSVPDYNFLWQVGYEFPQPKVVPAGTRVRFRGAFDNSPQNLANPDPSATVYWGDQSSSEMFAGFIDFSN